MCFFLGGGAIRCFNKLHYCKTSWLKANGSSIKMAHPRIERKPTIIKKPWNTPLKSNMEGYGGPQNDGPWKMHLLLNMAIFGIHVSFRGCKYFTKKNKMKCFRMFP